MGNKAKMLSLAVMGLLLFIAAGCDSGGSAPATTSSGKTDAATSAGSAAEKPAKIFKMRLGHEVNEDHPYHFGAVFFKEKVEELTKGGIEIQIFPNGSLGTQAAMLENVSMGTLDMCATNTPVYESLIPEWGILTIPFLFENYEHCFAVMKSDIGKEFAAMAEPHGIKVLSFLRQGGSNPITTFPLENPEDVKGRKMRIQPGKSFTLMGSALGMIVTPTSYSEVYAALQMGTVDGAIQPFMNVFTNKFYEVAPHYADIGLCYMTEPIAMNLKLFNSLPPEYQKAVEEAAMYAMDMQNQAAIDFDAANMQHMLENGLIVTKGGPRQAWLDSVQSMYDGLSEWKPQYDRIKNFEY